jgi:phage terminase small subunit
LSDEAKNHFRFVAGELGACGVVKRIDGAALSVLADLWASYWQDRDLKALEKWMRLAGKFGLTPVDRAHLMAGVEPAKPDADEERYFTVAG